MFKCPKCHQIHSSIFRSILSGTTSVEDWGMLHRYRIIFKTELMRRARRYSYTTSTRHEDKIQLDAIKIQCRSARVRPSRVAYSLLSSAARARISSRLCISPTQSELWVIAIEGVADMRYSQRRAEDCSRLAGQEHAGRAHGTRPAQGCCSGPHPAVVARGRGGR